MTLEGLPEQKVFFERKTIPLENGGEVEVFIRQDADQIYSFGINVRSEEEKMGKIVLGDEKYYEKFKSGDLPITGDGSIHGLLVASQYLDEVLERLKKSGAKELWVDGDDPRVDAYRRALLRKGFEETIRENGGPAFVYRF